MIIVAAIIGGLKGYWYSCQDVRPDPFLVALPAMTCYDWHHKTRIIINNKQISFMITNRNDIAGCKPVANLIQYIDESDGGIDLRKANQLLSPLKTHLEKLIALPNLPQAYLKLKQISTMLAKAQDNYDQEEMSGIYDKRNLVGELMSAAHECILSAIARFQYRIDMTQRDLFATVTVELNDLFEQLHKKYRRLGLMYVLLERPNGVQSSVEALIQLTATYGEHQHNMMKKGFAIESDSLLLLRTLRWKSTSIMLSDLSNAISANARELTFENSQLIRSLQHETCPVDYKKVLEIDIELIKLYLQTRHLLVKDRANQSDKAVQALKAMKLETFHRTHIEQLEKKAMLDDKNILFFVFTTLNRVIDYAGYYSDKETTDKTMHEVSWMIKIIEGVICFVKEKQACMNEVELIVAGNLIARLVFPLNKIKPLVAAKELMSLESKAVLPKKKKNNLPKKQLKTTQKNSIKKTASVTDACGEKPSSDREDCSSSQSAGQSSDASSDVKKEFDNAWLVDDKVFMKVYSLLEAYLGDSEKAPMIYVRGGMLRSLMLDRPVRDIDILVQANLIKVYEFLRASFGRCELRQGPYPVIVVVVDNVTFEICGLFDKLEVLANSNDITINALFWNRHTGLIDIIDASKDMHLKIIRNTNPETNFKIDPNRMYRAVRFFHQLDFSGIEAKSEQAIQQVALEKQKYSQAYPPVRTYYELKNLFLFGMARQVFLTLDKLNLLCFLLPFCKDLNADDKTQVANALSEFDKNKYNEAVNSIPILLAILIYCPMRRSCPEVINSSTIEKDVSTAIQKVSSCMFFPPPREEHENNFKLAIKDALIHGEVREAGLSITLKGK